ncbi:MAG: tetratricopeptide repeat protein [Acidobacteriia bacterium]|nr:tetratricopeptide repeat protein [Terriglobia bacterium]
MGSATQNRIEPSEESIRAALRKLSSSPRFASSERLCRFLNFTVEETLAGRTGQLKETIVGAEVFGRKPDYDPRLDAVVRIEAVKLRARLKEYYDNEGRLDPVRIDLPKGGYVPAFSLQLQEGAADVSAPVAPQRRLWIAALALVPLAAIGIWWLLHTRPPASDAAVPSIAVLPFVDLSEAKDQEYFCDGMTEEIIDALARVRGFHVAARSSAFAFKNKQQDIREIGRKLNVGAVLEGSVRKSGNRLRVTAQLNSVTDGYHLWSETYEREMKDIFALQDEISRAIVSTLRVQLGEAGKAPLVSPPTGNLEAYDLYLEARYLHSKWRPEPMRQSIALFERAIAQDPSFAPAYAGLAASYTWLGFFRVRPRDVMPGAKEAARKALALDSRLGAAHISLGDVKALYDWDWEGARREYQTALEINPDDWGAHFSYALIYLAPLGRISEAIREMQRARELDPLNVTINTYLGMLFDFGGQYDRAVRQLQDTLAIAPDFAEAYSTLFKVYLDQHKFDDAHAALDRFHALVGQTVPGLADAQLAAAEGRIDSARQMLAACERVGEREYVGAGSVACIYVALGDKDAAFRNLERGFAERDGMLAYMKTYPALSGLRSDPRFRELLRRVNLPVER